MDKFVTAKQKQQQDASKQAEQQGSWYNNDQSQFILSPDQRKRLVITNYRGSTYVHIREYFPKDDGYHPTKKGVSLTVKQFDQLVNNLDEIRSKVYEMANQGLDLGRGGKQQQQ